MSGGIPGVAAPTHTLTGEAEVRYVKTMQATLRAARLNNSFPDARKIASHIGVLSPQHHQGLYPGLDVDARSGLPSYREWTRAQTDVQLAPDQLRQLGARATLAAKAAKSPGSIHERQLVKHDYYAAISRAALTPLGDMAVQLRNLDPQSHRAAFHVVFDKLDASGLFVRYAIDLVQTSQAWTEKVVVLDDEAAKHTEAFRSLIYKFTSLDAEFTLVKLATMGGLSVERVIKGVMGPVLFPWMSQEQTGPFAPLLAQGGEGAFVAHFSQDMAAIDVSEDRDNDPFEDLVGDRLSADARQGYDRARQQYGYKVFKDRKFVTPRALVPGVQQLCAARKTKNIVYGV